MSATDVVLVVIGLPLLTAFAVITCLLVEGEKRAKREDRETYRTNAGRELHPPDEWKDAA